MQKRTERNKAPKLACTQLIFKLWISSISSCPTFLSRWYLGEGYDRSRQVEPVGRADLSWCTCEDCQKRSSVSADNSFSADTCTCFSVGVYVYLGVGATNVPQQRAVMPGSSRSIHTSYREQLVVAVISPGGGCRETVAGTARKNTELNRLIASSKMDEPRRIEKGGGGVGHGGAWARVAFPFFVKKNFLTQRTRRMRINGVGRFVGFAAGKRGCNNFCYSLYVQ